MGLGSTVAGIANSITGTAVDLGKTGVETVIGGPIKALMKAFTGGDETALSMVEGVADAGSKAGDVAAGAVKAGASTASEFIGSGLEAVGSTVAQATTKRAR